MQTVFVKEVSNSVKIIGHDTSVIKGGNVTLFCNLTETKENFTYIVWQKQTRGNPEKETNKDHKTEHNHLLDKVKFIGNIKEKNGSIQLLGMTLQDDGIYTCIFIFPSGKNQTNINITVLVPSVGKVIGRTHVSGHFDKILASCVAHNGRPAADVFWRLSALNDSLRTETSYTEHKDGSVTAVSHILGAPSKYLNQKKIQCVVKHSTLTKELEVDYVINIHYPPELVEISPDNPTETQQYLCSVDCNPTPTSFIWTKVKGSTLHSDSNKLFVPKSSSDFNGIYICTASNQYGSASGFLYVHKPGSADDCWFPLGLVFSCAVLWFFSGLRIEQ
ncbi:nectin-3-like [Carassius carassius]|uniref:nectin-3-like n=1 Tax=Carassius carassius TaxID=217509 RepID=UPI002868A29C|nr:nectin-3-like [Carassius carassius]